MDDLSQSSASRLARAKLTIPEAAFVTKASVRDIDREIDAQIVRSSGAGGRRALGVDALVYVKAVAPLRTDLTPALRRRISRAIAGSIAKGESVAKIEALQFPVEALRREIQDDYAELEKAKQMIESRKAVLGGAPVIRGTRVSVRLIASLIKKGVTEGEIQKELELTGDQVRAAVIYDRIAPQRGRPPIKRRNVRLHVPAD
jgi:uncharacterized protein (DUF433 family)